MLTLQAGCTVSFLDGTPIVCGGAEDNVGSFRNPCSTTHDECYRYVASSNTWELSGTMPFPKRWMAHTYSGMGSKRISCCNYRVTITVTTG